MALAATTIWEVETGGSDTLCSGGFNPGNANMASDGAIASANTSAPVLTSASYNFVAGDVGAWVYLKSGTSSIPGWYKIASVSANAATLTATIGAAVLAAGTPSTATGCGTTGSLTSQTWTVDYSQQAAAGFAFTDMVAASTTTFTSAAKPIGKNMVGNIVAIASGTGWNVVSWEVSSVSGTTGTAANFSSGTTIATNGSTGGTGSLGGAFASFGQATSKAVASNKIWMASGAYSQAANPTINMGSVTPANGSPYTQISGYASVRGDGTNTNRSSWPVITMTTGCTTGIPLTINGLLIQFLTIDANGATNGSANTSPITSSGSYCNFRSVWLKNFKQYGISITGNYNTIVDSDVTGGVTSSTGGINLGNTGITCKRNTIHGNICTGIVMMQSCSVIACLIYSNTGVSSDGISAQYNANISNCSIYSNGRDGIRLAYIIAHDIKNNVIVGNTGYGINYSVGNYSANDTSWDGNAYYNNTLGARNNIGTGLIDVTLTGDPFTNAASGNFALNNTAGAGAACRAAGIPGVFPGGLTTGYLDIGAVQSQSSGGGFIPSTPVFGAKGVFIG